MNMKTYVFTLVLDGPADPDEPALEKLLEAGCDDATFGTRAGQPVADFDRAAPSLSDAVVGAIADIESSGAGYRVVRAEPDELVSLTAIAQRTGRTRESIRLLAAGERGAGDFPPPLATVDSKSRIWRWSEVAQWFAQTGENATAWAAAQYLAALNGALETRNALAALAAHARDEPSVAIEVSPEAVAALPDLIEGEAAAAGQELSTV